MILRASCLYILKYSSNNPELKRIFLLRSSNEINRNFSNSSRNINTNKLISQPVANVLFFRSNSSKSSNPQPLPTSSPKPVANIIFFSWRTFTAFAVFGTAMLLFMYKLKTEKEEAQRRQRKQAIGKMAIGGSFELIDGTGKLRKSEEFLGKWLLIYFGFTHCPDICPEELEKMVKAVNLVEKVDMKAQLHPIFITVDPSRDDKDTVAKYVKDFSPKLLGLTGSLSQIEQVTKAYRVYFSSGPKDQDNDYIVDHTVIMYFVDPEGNFVDYYGQNKTAEEIATACAIHMGMWNPSADKK